MTERDKIFQEHIKVSDTLVLPIVIFDTRGCLIHVNEAFCAFFKFERMELVGKLPPFSFWPPEEAPHIRELFEEMVIHGKVKKIAETVFMKKDGTRVPVLNYRAIIKDGRGTVIGFIGFITDSTERRQAEAAIRESEKKHRLLIESIRDGIARVDMQGRFLDINNALLNMLGYTDQEMRQMLFKDLTPPEFHALHERHIQEHILRQGFSDGYETKCIKKDGGLLNVSLSIWLEKNEDGRPVAMGATIRDITEAKKKEKLLARYHLLFENAADAIFFIRYDDNSILDVNEAALDLYGYSRQEILSKNAREMDISNSSEIEGKIRKMEVGVAVHFESVHVGKAGREIPVDVTCRLLEVEGEKAVVAIVRDITDRQVNNAILKAKFEEIEKLNGFLMGREKRIIELKKQVDQILENHGEAKKYNA